MSEGNNAYTITTQNGDRKFIGGAAAARLNAKKKMRSRGTRILRPDEVLKSRETLPSSLSPFERFFAAILRSEPTEFVRGNAHDVWNVICNRLGLPIPKAPLPDYYSTQRAHFANRASLVMEESRQTVADGLRLLSNSYKDNSRRSTKQQQQQQQQ